MSALVTSAARHGARIRLGEDALYAVYLGLVSLQLVVLIGLAATGDLSHLEWVARATLESVGGTWGRLSLERCAGMAHASEIALAILNALTGAYSAGQTPQAIILDDATREGLQALHIGHWSEGPATWSLFGVPVVTGLMSGWRLRLSSETAAVAAGED